MKELTDVVKEKSPFRHYGIGKPNKVETFEKEAKEYFGRKLALAVSSGSELYSVLPPLLESGRG